MDLLLRRGQQMLGIEVKCADASRMTPSLRTALEELELERIVAFYTGSKRYAISDRIEAVPISTLASPGQLFGRAARVR